MSSAAPAAAPTAPAAAAAGAPAAAAAPRRAPPAAPSPRQAKHNPTLAERAPVIDPASTVAAFIAAENELTRYYTPVERPVGMSRRGWRRAKRADPDRKVALRAARAEACIAAAQARWASREETNPKMLALRARVAARKAFMRVYDARGAERRAARHQGRRIYQLQAKLSEHEDRQKADEGLRTAWGNAVARARHLELEVEVLTAKLKRKSEECDDKEQCIRGLLESRAAEEEASSSEESEESGEEIVIRRWRGDGSVVVGAAAERPTRRLRPRLPSDADSEDEEEAVGYDVVTGPDLQGSVEDTPPSQRPQVSAWMTTRVAPPTPAAPVKSGDTIEMVLVVAPKGISQIEID
jgi:hypothetical protein